MPGASRPGAHFRVDFDDATFAEDLEHTSSDTGRELAQRERDKLTDEGYRLTSSSAATPRPETAPACLAASRSTSPDQTGRGEWSSNCASPATGGPFSPASPSARVTPPAPERSASIRSLINEYTASHHDADRRFRAD